MDLKDIKNIIDLMKENDLSVFELEKDGFKLKLQKGLSEQPNIITPIALAPVPGGTGASPSAAELASGAQAAGTESGGAGLRDISSPMVGTFYRSPSPDASTFVEIGTQVSEDTVVCIIEAMKVMNEIKAETSGVIAQIVAENGKPVQFGQALFKVR